MFLLDGVYRILLNTTFNFEDTEHFQKNIDNMSN